MLLPTIHSAGDDPGPPPMVLLHGFLSSAHTDFVESGWMPRLSAAGRRAMAVDLPAHGPSPAVGQILSTTAVVDAIADTAARFFPDEAVDVVGYSLGARLAWELPAAGMPVRRMVLGGLGVHDPFAGISAGTLQRAFDGDDSHPIAAMIAGLIRDSGRDADALAALVTGLGAEPFDPARNVPSVPVLLAGGTDDPMVQGLRDLAATLPHGEYADLPGDHLAALASPEFWDAAVRALA